jgi:hypothetical protein
MTVPDALKLEKPCLLCLDTSTHSLPSSCIPTPLGTPKLVNSLLPGNEGCPTRGKRLDYTHLHEYSKETLENKSTYPKYSRPVRIVTIAGSKVEIEGEWVKWVYAAIQSCKDNDHPSYEQTLTQCDVDRWQVVHDDKIMNVECMKMFELTDLPQGQHVLKAGWVHVVKHNTNGMPVCYEARLVIKGYVQCYGVNYTEVLAHVLHTDSWHILIVLTTQLNWDVHQLDIAGAFLNSKVEEEIFMEQVPGYKDGSGLVLSRVGSLYGLKQAPCMWNWTLGSKLLDCSYTWLESELSCFIWHCDNCLAILAIYVDGIAIFTTQGYTDEVKAKLLGLFEMQDMGKLGHFLGYWVTWQG